MKRKIFLVVLIVLMLIAGLFILTGCASDNEDLSKVQNDKKSFVELKYEEPKGYENTLNLKDSSDTKILNYTYKDLDGSISLNYLKGKGYSEIEDLYYSEHRDEEINGTTWRVMNDDSTGVKSRFYYTIHNDALYYIELNGIDKFQDEFEGFIKNIEF